VGKLYFREGWDGAEQLLFDPATYKAGVTTTIQSIVPSWDGKYVAMGFSSGGAEWSEIRVLDVERGTLLPESIYPSLGAFGWMKDSKSFFYDSGKVGDIKSLDILLNRKTKAHKLGTETATDRDIFSNESNPELGITAKERPVAFIDESCPDYIIGRAETAQWEMRIFYAPMSELKHKKIKWDVLCKPSDNLVYRGLEYQGFQFYGDHVYAATHADAPKYKVVRTNVKHPDWEHAETVIPEGADSIQSITKSKHYLLVVYSDGIVGRLVKYDLATGKTMEIKLPASGTVDVRCPDWKTDRCLMYITSWTSPLTIYDFDAQKDTFAKSIFNTDVSYPSFENLVAEEVEMPGHDGAMIPLTIIYQKGIPLDGSNSCILRGYGAYGFSATPEFTILKNSLATHGVVFAIAHVRGGGEKGEAWYKAGYKTTKPNTWKDFISCADYLVKKGYTSPRKLAAIGTSAGGILISRAIEERPDLFAAAVCHVGVANAMRHEFRPFGPFDTEFGTVKDPVECQALFEMDGVQHVQKGVKYPAVMGVGGWNDPRYPAWQPGKFVAALQAATASEKPVLMKVNYNNGHFTEEKIITFKDFASQYAFLLWQTGHKDFQPVK
jgi:prolyl oligopeptidase